MHEFAAESIGNIHHGSRFDACLVEFLDNIAACLWFELAFEQVFASLESRGSILVGLHDKSFALKELQTHVCCAKVARYTNEVIDLCSVAIDNVGVVCSTQASDGNGESRHRGRGVATHKIHVVLLTSKANTCIKFFEIFDRETFANTQRNSDLCGSSVHGVDVREVYNRRFVTKVLERYVFEVEMNTFKEQIGGDEGAFIFVIEHGSIISNPLLGGWLYRF